MKYSRYWMFGRPKLQRKTRYCIKLSQSYADLDRPLSWDLIPFTSYRPNSKGKVQLRRNKVLKEYHKPSKLKRDTDGLELIFKVNYKRNPHSTYFSTKVRWDRRDEYNFRF